MEKKNKKITTVFVDQEILEHIKNNPKIKNLSEWINLNYPEEFMNLKIEEEKFAELQIEMEQCQERINFVKKSIRDIQLPKLAEDWIKAEGVKRYQRCLDGFVSFEGMLKSFNKKFDLILNQRQFKILLEKYKDGLRM